MFGGDGAVGGLKQYSCCQSMVILARNVCILSYQLSLYYVFAPSDTHTHTHTHWMMSTNCRQPYWQQLSLTTRVMSQVPSWRCVLGQGAGRLPYSLENSSGCTSGWETHNPALLVIPASHSCPNCPSVARITVHTHSSCTVEPVSSGHCVRQPPV